MKNTFYAFCYLLLLSNNVIAYQEPTHEVLSVASTEKSVLNTSNVLVDLGLNLGIINEQAFNNYISKNVAHNVRDYIAAGSNFEDEGLRSLNHFYDPYNNIGLNSWIGYKSPNWALEDDELDELPEQEFSLTDANDYLYRALSGKDPGNETKETNFGKLFRTIGQVIHHVQDMAQPQHVRDDDHCGEVACSKAEFLGVFKPSLYEELSNGSRKNLPFSGYGSVSFPKARDFWHNSNWSGMADFTNQNFISIGTNFIVNDFGNYFTNINYPEPKPLNEVTQPVSIGDKLPETGLTGWMEFIPTMVIDRNLAGTSATFRNDDASTLSIFDQDLQLENACIQYTRKAHNDLTKTYIYETCRLFTYNRFNVESAQKYLIPRAVAYSAGLINHFFRGRLDVTKFENTTDIAGNSVVAITIKNTSAQNLSMTNGKLEIFYDAIVGGVEIRKAVQFADGETGDVTEIINGAETIINIISPADVAPDKQNPFVVVYKGLIGADPGVAGKVFPIKYETALLSWKTSFIGNEYYTDIHRSIDYGKTWKNVTNRNFQINRLGNYLLLGEIISLGSNQAMALIGHVNDAGEPVVEAIATKDNGRTWENSLESTKLVSTDQFPWQTPYNNWNNSKYIKTTNGGYLFSLDMVKQITTDNKIIYAPHIVESFDLGKTWTVAFTPITDIGVEFVSPYKVDMGNGLILIQGYNKDTLLHESYKSTNAGSSWNFNALVQGMTYTAPDFSTGLFSHIAMQDAEQILAIDYTTALLEETFMVSNDLGASWTHTFLINELAPTWPYMEVYNISYLGNGRVVAYVFDGWSNWDYFFYGVITSADYGQTWEIASSGFDIWDNYTSMIEKLGVVTNDPALEGVIHSSSK